MPHPREKSPGSFRDELGSVIERVVVLCRNGLIRAADLPPHICGVRTNGTGPRRNGTYGATAVLR